MSKFEKPKFLDPTKSVEENCEAFWNKLKERVGDRFDNSFICGFVFSFARSAISMAYALYAKNEPEKFNEMTILEFCNPVAFNTKYRLLSTKYFADQGKDEELKGLLETPARFLIVCCYHGSAETNKNSKKMFDNFSIPVRDFILGKKSKFWDQ